jgi:hypothetical protein
VGRQDQGGDLRVVGPHPARHGKKLGCSTSGSTVPKCTFSWVQQQDIRAEIDDQ